MNKLLAVIPFVFWVQVALAETIVARSGEHPSFSRIVLPFASKVTWEIGRAKFGYEIQFGADVPNLDVSDIFRLMPKKRIIDAKFLPEKSQLFLFLDCTCYANVFEIGERKIVIDLIDGIAPEESRFEAPLSHNIGRNIEPPVLSLLTPIEPKDTAEALRRSNVDQSERGRALEYARKIMGAGLLPSNHFRPKPEDPQPNDIVLPNVDFGVGKRLKKQVQEMQDGLLMQVGRASSLGYLSSIHNLDAIKSSKPLTRIAREALSDDVGSFRVSPEISGRHMNTISAAENDVSIRMEPIKHLSSQSSGGCAPDAAFDLTAWGNGADIFGAIARGRRLFFDELGEPTDIAIETLSKAYIFAGFGSEAIRVIDYFEADDTMGRVLRELATLMDNDSPQEDGYLVTQRACQTSGAMWAMLASPKLEQSGDFPESQVLKSFSALPLHLRRLLGPRLIALFLEADSIDASLAVRNAIDRAEGTHGADFAIADAELLFELGDPKRAKEMLGRVASGNSAVSSQALIKLVNRQISETGIVPMKSIHALESATFELEGTVQQPLAIATLTRAHSKNGNFSEAFRVLNRAITKDQVGHRVANSLILDVFRNATQSLDDANFLPFYYTHSKSLGAMPLPVELQQSIANRLIDNKLPIAARQLLGGKEPRDIHDVLILAKAANLTDEPMRALELTSDYPNNQDIIRTRIEAAYLLNDNGLAAREFGRLGEDGARTEALWRNKDFNALAKGNGGELSALSTILMLGETRPEVRFTSGSPINSYERELVFIQDLRNSISNTLSQFPSP